MLNTWSNTQSQEVYENCCSTIFLYCIPTVFSNELKWPKNHVSLHIHVNLFTFFLIYYYVFNRLELYNVILLRWHLSMSTIVIKEIDLLFVLFHVVICNVICFATLFYFDFTVVNVYVLFGSKFIFICSSVLVSCFLFQHRGSIVIRK